MEQYQVHGKWVSFNDVEYGMFASRIKEEGDLEYAMVSLIPFVRRINQTSKEDAIVYLTELQKEAKKQVKWKYVPRKPAVIIEDRVRNNIKNMIGLTDIVLQVLQKK